MAVILMKKIKLIGSSRHRQNLLDVLQSHGALEITEIISNDQNEELVKVELSPDKLDAAHNAELNIANIDFALKLIKPFAKQRNIFEGPVRLPINKVKERASNFDFDVIIDKCRSIEEQMVALRNEYVALNSLHSELDPWQSLVMPLNHIGTTDNTKTIIGTVQKTAFEQFKEELLKVSKLLVLELINETESSCYVSITFTKEIETEVREVLLMNKFSQVELPSVSHDVKSEISKIKQRKGEVEQELANFEEELRVVGKSNEDLQIVHDYFVWERDRIYADHKSQNTEYTFTLEGWMPIKSAEKTIKSLKEVTDSFEIFDIEPSEGEQAPVAIRNKGFMGMFEAVTNVYGLPLPTELDPTPFLAAFFIIFFGLCLTDAGYGILLFVICALALKFTKLDPGMKKLVKLIMYGGIITFIMGALFGGWFGMTADQAPGFLTFDKVLEGGEIVKAFKWQIINPTQGNGPLTFLILAATLGYIQVLFGLLVDGYWKIKTHRYLDATLDSFLWFFFLVMMGLFGVSKGGIFLADYAEIITNIVLGTVVLLVLTQGRSKKNIFMKLISGVLSLYGLVGYFADILSYSRLMALGLGTGIIGFAFNTIGGLVGGIPYIGIVFTIIVILIGHTLNIAISTLGAFIHSSRLQFVEFFGKFMEGGGRAFSPLQKACKYILITEDNN
ncbi:V-type ATP synthase subunit I [Patescibacteria group bacterium]|nr:V-type ATP synthase subunit I [Patescibacteria group bacterium]